MPTCAISVLQSAVDQSQITITKYERGAIDATIVVGLEQDSTHAYDLAAKVADALQAIVAGPLGVRCSVYGFAGEDRSEIRAGVVNIIAHNLSTGPAYLNAALPPANIGGAAVKIVRHIRAGHGVPELSVNTARAYSRLVNYIYCNTGRVLSEPQQDALASWVVNCADFILHPQRPEFDGVGFYWK